MTVTAEEHFAIIPEWVLYADVSAQAIRTYSVLRRYADKRGKAHPSYKTLAEMGRCSVATVRRSLDELLVIGAIEKQPRHVEGRQTSNDYVVMSSRRVLTGEQGGVPAHEQVPVLTGEQGKNQSHEEPEPEEPDEFDAFWTVYPRKVGKGSARKAFTSALKKADAGVICEAAAVYASAVRGTEARFVAHPASWLNAERWEDEGPTASTPSVDGLAWAICSGCGQERRVGELYEGRCTSCRGDDAAAVSA